MKALVLKEYNRFVVEDAPEPPLAPDAVLVAVKACGICGSDVHGMDGSTGRRQPPIIMGHEAAGIIARVGASVKEWEAGTPVTFDSTLYCGTCAYCRAGQINLCNNRRVLGVSCAEYRQPGAFAEYVAIPQQALYRVPGKMRFEQAAMTEPLSIAFHAVKRAEGSRRDKAVVVGAGLIGLLLVQTLRLNGWKQIIAVDIAPEKLALAARFGACETVDSSKGDALARILDFTAGEGADAVFEAVGLPATVDLAVRAARKGGMVVLVGNVAPTVPFPLQACVTRELSIFGSCASAGEYPACLEALAAGSINVAPLISAVVPLEEGGRWFERLHRREAGLFKVILAP